jgi:hypothetical protein
MPFSWFRVPSNTSKKLHDCLLRKDEESGVDRLRNDDHSKVRVAACIEEIVGQQPGAEVIGPIYFEANGKFAHVHVEYRDDEQRLNLIVDLEAEQAVDLFPASDIGDLIDSRYPEAS